MKKNMICGFLLLASLLGGFAAQGQGFVYQFGVDNETYTPLENATSVTHGQIWDDPQEVIPIGFEFEFFGNVVTDLELSAGLGATVAPSGESGSPGLIFTYDSDLIDRGYLDEVSESEIVYVVEGMPGSRILKVEWQNAGFFNELNDTGESNDFVNLQLWLYEGSNNIEMRFGPRSIADNTLVHDFLSGPLVGLVDTLLEMPDVFGTLYYLHGSPEMPDVDTLTSASQSDNLFNNVLAGNPADGQVYRFSPVVTSSHDVASQERNIRLFPQPARDVVYVEYIGEDGSGESVPIEWYIQVFDLPGQEVVPATVFSGLRTEVDLSGLAPGTYIMKILDDQEQTTLKKVVKTK